MDVKKISLLLAVFLLAAGGSGLAGDFSGREGFVWSGHTVRCTATRLPDAASWFRTDIRRNLEISRYAGKLLEISGEFRWIDSVPALGKKQGMVQLIVRKRGGGDSYFGAFVTPGDTAWKRFSFPAEVGFEAESITLLIGFQRAGGCFEVRNLNVEILGNALPLFRSGNRAWLDETAGDGRGGWTDQGPGRDGRVFLSRLRQQSHVAGVPFFLAELWNRQIPSIVVMKSRHNPAGSAGVEFAFPTPVKARYLYLLHALSYAKGSGVIGRILLQTPGGRREIPVTDGRDVGDWWGGKAVPNAGDALRVKLPDGSVRVLYVTRWELPEESVSAVSFQPEGGETTWILCGATLSERKFEPESAPLPKPLTIREGAEWGKPLRFSNLHLREPGSILDLSGRMERRKISEETRVIIRDGRFVYAKEPSRRIRFFCSPDTMNLGFPTNLGSRGLLEVYVGDLVRHGFNMIRIHINNALMYASGTPAEFNTLALDNFDYLVKLCRENGIYIMMNVMESQYGFFPRPFDRWGNPERFDNRNHMDMRYALYFSPQARENWKAGVKRLFDRVNPYTGVKLKEDPALLLLEGYNEQEFAFNYRDITPQNQALTVGPWREFLRKRYRTIEAYNAEHKSRFAGFEEIPCFTIRKKDDDVNAFIYEVSRDLLRFYRQTLRGIGVRAYLTNYDFVTSLLYNFVRRDCDYVGMHSYHDHPLNTSATGRGSYNRQTSSIAANAYFIRSLTQGRIFGKPVLSTEYDQPFWNRYRYERSFTMGAYAAFQDVDALTLWAEPVRRSSVTDANPWRGGMMRPFRASADPLSDGSLLLTWCMFIRGDVAPAEHAVRVIADRKSVFERNPNAVESPELTSLSLLVRYAQQSVDSPEEVTPAGAREVLIPSRGGGRIRVEGMFIEDAGSSAGSEPLVAMLRRKGFLSEANRSDGRTVFESETGELYLENSRNFMTVNTPRLQGMCGRSGAVAQLADFEVVSHDYDGNLSLVAMDGLRPIRNAGRLLLVRLTNALNSGMRFADQEMCRVETYGTVPALLRNSRFTVKVRHANAAELRLYPLSLEGKRSGVVLVPGRVENSWATFSVDTSRDGNTVFFEIARNVNAKH